MSDDLQLHDGHTIKFKRVSYLQMWIDGDEDYPGEYWGSFNSEKEGMVFFKTTVQWQLDARDERDMFGPGGDPANAWKREDA
jgi:hypothetical protein